MVINSTDINKTNKQIISHFNWAHWTQKKTTAIDVENPGPGLGQAHKCGRVNQFMRFQPSPLDNWISNGNTYVNKR
jgi:hypothetical protein